MVAGAGFEPTTFGLWAQRATELLHPAINNNKQIWRRKRDSNPCATFATSWFSRPVPSTRLGYSSNKIGAWGRTWTDTRVKSRRILSPVRLPIPPLRHIVFCCWLLNYITFFFIWQPFFVNFIKNMQKTCFFTNFSI